MTTKWCGTIAIHDSSGNNETMTNRAHSVFVRGAGIAHESAL